MATYSHTYIVHTHISAYLGLPLVAEVRAMQITKCDRLVMLQVANFLLYCIVLLLQQAGGTHDVQY